MMTKNLNKNNYHVLTVSHLSFSFPDSIVDSDEVAMDTPDTENRGKNKDAGDAICIGKSAKTANTQAENLESNEDNKQFNESDLKNKKHKKSLNKSLNKAQTKLVLNDISCEIHQGDFVVLLGSNGSGKTTFLRQLHPVLADTGYREGCVMWDGHIVGSDPDDIKSFAMVNQHVQEQLVTDKVWHELAFGLENQGKKREEIDRKIAEIATYFGIEKWFNKDVNELSGGQQQILSLTAAIITNPSILLLDEPMSQLDPLAADDFVRMIHRINYELGITIVIAEHDIERLAPYTDKILVLDSGKLLVNMTMDQAAAKIAQNTPSIIGELPVAAQIALAIDTDIDKTRTHSDSRKIAIDNSEIPLSISQGQQWIEKAIISRSAKNDAVSTSAHAKNGAISQDALDTSNTFDTPSPLNFTVSNKQPIILSAKNLYFSYTPSGPVVLKGTNLDVHEGEIIAIVGSNGSGKSTFLQCLSGELAPYQGRVCVHSHRLTHKNISHADTEETIGYLPQHPDAIFLGPRLWDDLMRIVGENGNKSHKNQSHIYQLIIEGARILGIDTVLDRNPADLSGGQAQAAALLSVLIRRPSILLLDEPSSGLDSSRVKKVCEMIQSAAHFYHISVVIVTHDLDFAAEIADTVGLFFDGHIVGSGPAHQFFAENNFYTTPASRLARPWWPEAITRDEIIQHINTAMSDE